MTLAIDIKLFIDPLLLKNSRHIELNKDAHNAFQNHFTDIIRLLQASKEENDPAWKAAFKKLDFPEISGTCLGYGAGSIHGRGFGLVLKSKTIRVAKQIIDIGIKDPDLFVAMALFEDKFGPDLISDMTTNIIFDALIKFNKRIINELGLNSKNKNAKGFLLNPFENTDIPIILLPNDILNDLPIVKDWDNVAEAAKKNQQLREELNIHIGTIWKKTTKRKKFELKNEALKSKESFSAFLSAVKNVPADSYDTNIDPKGVIRWARKGAEYANKYRINLINPSEKSLRAVYMTVCEIITQFKHLIENLGINKELYEPNKKPRKESTAQKLFFAISYSYCKANNIDISPEIDTGTGKVDFKFSTNFDKRVLVEIKLSTNQRLVHGYTNQLETYKVSQQTTKAIYLVINIGNMGNKDKRLIEEKNKDPKVLPDIKFIDGVLKQPASLR